MIPYGKTASSAIAAASYLAEHYGEAGWRASSGLIAEARQLPRPLVAKVLTILSQAGLVGGSPGPGGGYFLSRDPAQVRLLEIVRLFEKVDAETRCPFGPHWCGSHEPCPLHGELAAMHAEGMRFLTETSLGVFLKR